MKASSILAWLPIVLLPTAVVFCVPDRWPAWVFMWILALALYAGCKWLTWRSSPAKSVAMWRLLGYLFAWPGLDAPAFLHTPNQRTPPFHAWLFAFVKLGLGVVLIAGIFPNLATDHDLVRGWVGMLGIVFVLHFGLFDVLSLAWQTLGVTAKPLMNWPVLATSVGEFWGQRWNTAFRDLTHRFLFRPLATRIGAKIALAVGFAFSGIVHDLVISLPARGGYGGPTAFFVLQGIAIFFERSTLGQRLGLAHGLRGWAFTMLVLLGPLVLLFHRPFVRTVVVPFLDWILQALG